jgi:tetratricopeptide (TPR) repeat protein
MHVEINWDTPILQDISIFQNTPKSKSPQSMKELRDHVIERTDLKIKKLWRELEYSNDLHKSLQICSKIKNLDPNDFQVYLHMARIYVELKEYSNADEFFLVSIEKEKDVSLVPLIEYSEFLIDTNRPAESLNYCERTLQRDSDNIDVHHIKSRIYVKTENFPEALELVEHVLERKKNNVYALYTKSMALRGLKNYSEALQVIDNALKTDKNNIRNLYGKALIICDQLYNDPKSKEDRYWEALQCIETVLSMDKNNIDALNVKCWIMIKWGEKSPNLRVQTKPLGSQESLLDLPTIHEIGLDCCHKVLSQDEHNFTACYYKCIAVFRSGKYEQAIKFCEEMFRNSGKEEFKELHKEIKNNLLEEDKNRIGRFRKPNKFGIMLLAISGSLVAIFGSLLAIISYATSVAISQTVFEGLRFTGAAGIKGIILFSILSIISIGFFAITIQLHMSEKLKFNPKDIPDLE